MNATLAPIRKKKNKGLKNYFKNNKKKISRILFMFSFLIIPAICFCIFYLYVNIDSFLMAFQRPRYGTVKEMVWTFENFNRIGNLFSTSEGDILGNAILNTVLFNCVGLFLGIPISILMSYFIYKKILGYKLFRFVLYLPTIICSSALVALFKYAIGDGGPLDALVSATKGTFVAPLAGSPSAIITILFYCLMFNLGSNIVLFGGAMNSLSTEVLEAAELDGVNWFQELIYIIIPSIWPTLSTMLILLAAGFLGTTGPILAFTQGSFKTMTLSYYIYALVSGQGANQDLYLASAIGLCMTAVSFPLALIVKRVVFGGIKEE